MSDSRLSHFDADGEPHLVDVSNKISTVRRAVAKSRVQMNEATASLMRAHGVSSKGDVLAVARLAAIQAVKNTAQWIPLCHSIPIEATEVSSNWISEQTLEWTVEVRTTAKTGVEMEAMVGATAAALTVYDMCKSMDRTMEITHVALWEKSGGRSGSFERTQEPGK